MKAIICDKCGITQKGVYCGASVEFNRVILGTPSEIHLCVDCTKAFTRWLKGETEDHGDNPENTD